MTRRTREAGSGFEAGGRWFSCDGRVTHVMGVINLSPESRNRHTVAETPRAALEMAHGYQGMGAAIVDLGAQSSHFESPDLDEEEELRRLLPALRLLVEEGFVVAVDTWKPEVARAALGEGAGLINDTGGLQDSRMVEVLAGASAAVVMTYVEGSNPHDVHGFEFADDKAEQIAARLRPRLEALWRGGVERVIVDPGISINYPVDYVRYTAQQLRVIRDLDALRALGRPVLVPIPRKRELTRVMALIALALEHRADLIRVHDVAAACDLVRFFGREAG